MNENQSVITSIAMTMERWAYALPLLALAVALTATVSARNQIGVDLCCPIIHIEKAKEVWTARDLATGRTFSFDLPAQMSDSLGLSVGDRVHVDWASGGTTVVSVKGTKTNIPLREPAFIGVEECCQIVGTRELDLAPGTPGAPPTRLKNIQVTARERETGATFSFLVDYRHAQNNEQVRRTLDGVTRGLRAGVGLSLDTNRKWAVVKGPAASNSRLQVHYSYSAQWP